MDKLFFDVTSAEIKKVLKELIIKWEETYRSNVKNRQILSSARTTLVTALTLKRIGNRQNQDLRAPFDVIQQIHVFLSELYLIHVRLRFIMSDDYDCDAYMNSYLYKLFITSFIENL